MQNYELVVVMLLGFLAFVGAITLIMIIWFLRQIQRSIDVFMAEVRKNYNMQSKTFDRSFAETNGELKKIAYRLENVAEQLRQTQGLLTDQQNFLADLMEELKQQNRKK